MPRLPLQRGSILTMNSAWMEPMSESSAQPAKRTATGHTDKENKEAQLTHYILSAQTAQTVRTMQGAIWHVFIGPFEIAEAAVTCAKEFGIRTKGQSGHKFGSPHVQAYRTFLIAIIKLLEAKASAGDQDGKINALIDPLSHHLKEYQEAQVVNAFRFISQFRAKKTKEGKGVVTIALSDLMLPEARHRTMVAITDALILLGCEYKAGSPPASDVERKHQKHIDELKALMGVK